MPKAAENFEHFPIQFPVELHDEEERRRLWCFLKLRGMPKVEVVRRALKKYIETEMKKADDDDKAAFDTIRRETFGTAGPLTLIKPERPTGEQTAPKSPKKKKAGSE